MLLCKVVVSILLLQHISTTKEDTYDNRQWERENQDILMECSDGDPSVRRISVNTAARSSTPEPKMSDFRLAVWVLNLRKSLKRY